MNNCPFAWNPYPQERTSTVPVSMGASNRELALLANRKDNKSVEQVAAENWRMK